MEKDKFLYLIDNNASLTTEEAEELAVLSEVFPYSQAIRNLAVRGAQINNLPDKQKQLNLAAVYAADRSILKALISSPKLSRHALPYKKVVQKKEPIAKEPIAKEPIAKEPIAKKEEVELKETKATPSPLPDTKPVTATKEKQDEITKTEAKPIPIPSTGFEPSKLSGDELLDELTHDLKKLKELKQNFEVAISNFDAHDTAPKVEAMDKKAEDKVPKAKKTGKATGIIAEIKSTKKKIKPSDPKQKEQLEIIDKFIKSKPSFGKKEVNDASRDTTDLSENSSVFSDNIVSETLVEILIKQGKKEKAVEVLKKLIWKFPQKKAYFAAQIEELTS